ncbi:MAG: hypothetical protein ACXVP4_09675 [Bacteroidia bacterium]
MKNRLVILILLITGNAFAQDVPADKMHILSNEQALKVICKELYNTKNKDADKEKYNKQLLQEFEAILKENNSFENYKFDSLHNDLGILTSADNKFRIINWDVPKDDGTFEYYGFIQEKYTNTIKKGLFKKEHIDSVQLYSLTDKSAEIKNPENAVTDNKKWFGALYNKIVIKKTKAKTYYTLLAWDGNDKFSRKKIIEVLTFDANGTPRFGADIFSMQKKYPKRVIFEYSANCNISLRYSAKKDSIVFDHLAPTSPQLEGQAQYYCSDGSYDGFGFKKGKWNYGEDVNATNEKDEKDKLYGDPHDKSIGNKESVQYIDPNKKKKKGK